MLVYHLLLMRIFATAEYGEANANGNCPRIPEMQPMPRTAEILCIPWLQPLYSCMPDVVDLAQGRIPTRRLDFCFLDVSKESAYKW
jgi:hypothetical protein